jgi:general secretion pathway protein J
VTLVEVLVTLAIFAVIGTAGFAMLDQIVRARDRGEGRLDRLAGMQRALFLFDTDLAQGLGGSFAVEDEGRAIAFRREAAVPGGGAIALRYGWQDGALVRAAALPGAEGAAQVLLPAVDAVAWRFHDRDRGWLDDWPPDDSPTEPGGAGANPQAVELSVTLRDGLALRRVALMPGEAR